MNVFELNGEQLIVVAAIIASDIAKGLTIEEQEIIAWLFLAIGQNLEVFGSIEGFRNSNKTQDIEEIVK